MKPVSGKNHKALLSSFTPGIRGRIFMLLLFASTFVHAQKRAYNISMVMPFCSKKIIDNPNCYDAQLGNLCREYYQGALIALDSFERAMVSVRLDVFDTENDSFTMLKIMRKPQLKEAQLIIGPVLQNGNKMLSGLAGEKEIFHVSPLMTFSKTKLEDPYWISANPDIPAYAEFLYDYIVKQNHDSANIIVINDKSSFDVNITSSLKKITPTSKNVKIRYVEYEKGIDIIRYLSLTLSNHIIIPSSHEVTVTNVLKNIKDTDDTFKMTSYGFPHWLEFKNPDFDIWERMQVSIITNYFVDYSDEQVKRFIAAYRERFFTEPSDAAFKGYDQMMLLGGALVMKGKNFMPALENKPCPALGTHYLFRRQQDGNYYQNDYLNVIRIEEMKMKKVY